MKKEFISTDDLAERWGLSNGTLRNWRWQKKGPPYFKIGDGARDGVYYKLDDILRYERAHKILTESR